MAVRRLWDLRKDDIVKIRVGLWKGEIGTVLKICPSHGVLTLHVNGKDVVAKVPVRSCSWKINRV